MYRLLKILLLAFCSTFVVGVLQSQEAEAPSDVVADLQEKLDQNPDDRAAIVKLANYYYDRGEWTEAEEWYERALEISADDPNVLTDLAVVQRNLGEPQLSLETLAKALAVKPDHWQAIYNKAVVLLIDLDQAAAAEDLIDELESMRAAYPDIPELDSLRAQIAKKASAQAPQLSPDIEAAARDLVRHQFPPEYLQEVYQQATQMAVVAVENNIQPSIGRALSASERSRLTILCNDFMREALPYSEIEDLLYPIVAKHLTLEELNEINSFLKSPVGKKLTSANAALMREGQVAGELLGQRLSESDLGRKFSDRLRSEFPQWFPAGEQE